VPIKKLDASQVNDILGMLAMGEEGKYISLCIGVSAATISGIKRGDIYTEVTDGNPLMAAAQERKAPRGATRRALPEPSADGWLYSDKGELISYGIQPNQWNKPFSTDNSDWWSPR